MMHIWILMADMLIVFLFLLCCLCAHLPWSLLQSGIIARFKHLD